MIGPVLVSIGERDLSCLRYAAQAVKSIEERFAGDPLLGVREGEATSDVLLALIARVDNAVAEGNDNA